MVRTLIIVIFILVAGESLYGQIFGYTWYPVTHFTGTETINGVNITVTPSGSVRHYTPTHCFTPYWVGGQGIGQNQAVGAFHFQFDHTDPDVHMRLTTRIRLAAINDEEVISFTVNGVPYTLTPANLSNPPASCAHGQPGLPGYVIVGGAITAPVGVAPAGDNKTVEVKISGDVRSLTVEGSNCYIGGVGYGVSFSYVFAYKGPVCVGDSLMLHAGWAWPGTTYSWTGPAGFSSGLSNPVIPDMQPENEGMYTLTMVYDGDTVTDSMYIATAPTPIPGIVFDEPVCTGSTLYLSTADTVTGISYEWTGPNGFHSFSRNPLRHNIQLQDSGTYHVHASLNGCTASAEAVISIRQPSSVSLAAVICSGSYYHFNGRALTHTGIYTDTLVAANGCDSVVTLDLLVNPVPEIEINTSDHDRLCIGDTLVLYATGARAYLWYEGNRTVISSEAELVYPLTDFKHQLTLIGQAENGCSDTVAIDLNVESCCTMFVSNAFTPNGDGMNDQFGVISRNYVHIQDYRMDIYNRWGQVVFIGSKPGDRWDGMFNGTAAEIGTYYYYIRGRCPEGNTLDQKGEVILIR